MKKNKILYSKDGKCPYCESGDKERAGRGGVGSSFSGKLPRASIIFWKCNNCGKIFIYQGK